MKMDRNLRNLNNLIALSNSKTPFQSPNKFNDQNCSYLSPVKLNHSSIKKPNKINQKTITNFNNMFESLTNTQISIQPKKPKLLKRASQRNQIKKNLQFSIGKILGSGQFGNVYLVQNTLNKSIYAMKKIKLERASQKLKQRILGQIKIQYYLNHQNCLKLYQAYKQDNHIVMILELGQYSLFDLLRKKKFFMEKQAAYYIRQTICALKYIHSQGVIHRDIKPQNLVLVNNTIKLADFGWSTYTNKKKRTTFCGTLDYVSPQVVVGCQYDQMVDVWSVGVLCYELCTGHAPFAVSDNINLTYQRILDVDIKFPKHLSLGVKNFISRLLVKIPSSRMNLAQALQHPWMKQFQMQKFNSIKNQQALKFTNQK